MKRKITVLMSLLFVLCASQSFAQSRNLTFETANSGAGYTWIMDQNGANPPLAVVANPSVSGLNKSPNVAKFEAQLGGADWALTYTDNISAFKFDTTNKIVKILVYKPTISNVGIKFEGSSGAVEILVANTLINTWEELTFDFSASIGNTYNRLVIIPDFTARTQTNVLYFDKVTIPKGNIPPPPVPTVGAPNPIHNAVNNNVISIFSGKFTDVAGTNFDPNWGQTTDATIVPIGTSANNTLKYLNLTYQGTQFGSNQDLSGHEYVHVDFWAHPSNCTDLGFFVISPGNEKEYLLVSSSTPATGAWVSLDIPLSYFSPPVDLSNVFQFKVDGNGTVWFDNLYFWSTPGYVPPASAPTAAAPTPCNPASSVMSIYSNTYTNVAGTNFNPNWGQATAVSNQMIAGNEAMKYAGLNYQGTQFASSLDVSGKDYLHVDFWTANSTDLGIFLISPGPNEVEYTLPIVGGEWVSVDIPLTHFSSVVNLADVIQFKVDGNGTIWFDNLYFWELTPAPATGCPITWTSLEQTTVLSAGTQLKKTANTPTGWSGGAISQDFISASEDGWVEMEALALNRRMLVGLAAYNTNSLSTSIRYGVELVSPGTAYITENGVRVNTLGEYVVGDIFRVSKEGGAVKYYHNGTLVYTSTKKPSCDYYADAAIFSLNGIVKATASFGCGSSRPTTSNDNSTLNFSEATAYPNPFEDNITINYATSVEEVKSIEMYSINGQHIRSIAISADGQTTINTSDLQSGLYIISINGTKHIKVVKM